MILITSVWYCKKNSINDTFVSLLKTERRAGARARVCEESDLVDLSLKFSRMLIFVFAFQESKYEASPKERRGGPSSARKPSLNRSLGFRDRGRKPRDALLERVCLLEGEAEPHGALVRGRGRGRGGGRGRQEGNAVTLGDREQIDLNRI